VRYVVREHDSDSLHESSARSVRFEQCFGRLRDDRARVRSDLDNMIKTAIKSAPDEVSFPAVAIRKLNAFKYWAEERHMCGLPVFPHLFTAEVLVRYLTLLRADEIEQAAKKGQKPTMSDVLKQEKE
jgi:hypothetical protein